MKKILLGIMLLISFSCSELELDKTPKPYDYGQNTLELRTLYQDSIGLIEDFYDPKNISGLIEIPTPHTGELMITSDKCNFYYNSRYSESKTLSFTYEELLKNKEPEINSCLFDVKLHVDNFDSGFRGYFQLLKKENKFGVLPYSFLNTSFDNGLGHYQIKEGNATPKKIRLNNNYVGDFYASGCGINFEKKNIPLNYEIKLNDLAKENIDCTLFFLFVNEKHGAKIGALQLKYFSDKIVPLTDPLIEKEKDGYSVELDSKIVGIGFNDDLKIRSKNSMIKKYKVIASKDSILKLRLATSNGRYLLLKIKDGKIVWRPLIHY